MLSPFCLAKTGLVTSPPSPPQLPLLHLGIHPPMQVPCSTAAMQADMQCSVSATSWQVPQAC